MRLAQISRKLKVKTSEVVAFIEQKFEDQIQNAPNTKIPDEYVSDIIAHFTVVEEEPILKKEVIIEESPAHSAPIEAVQVEEEKVAIENPENNPEGITDGNNNQDQLDDDINLDTEETEELNIEDGVIKAPKVEVQGIKVVGKIELPGDKTEEATETKETTTSEEIEESTEESSATSDNVEENLETVEEDVKAEKKEPIVQKPVTPPVKTEAKKKNNSNKKKNSLTYEEERNLAQKDYRDELQRLKKIEKKKKKANYDRLMKEGSVKKSTKKVKTKKGKKEEPKPATKIAVKKKEAPKSLWGKFLYWLNN